MIKNYKKDAILSLIGFVIPVVVALIAIPTLMTALGAQDFGFLTLVWAVIGLSSIFDLGVGRALTYQISRKHDVMQEVGSIVSSGMAMVLLVSIPACILTITFSSEILKLINGDNPTNNNLEIPLVACAIGILPTALNSAVRGVLEGFGDFYQSMINRLVSGLLMFIVPLGVVFLFESNLSAMVIGIVLGRSATLIHAYRRMGVKLKPPSIHDVKQITAYGSWVSLSNVLSPIMVYCDRFIVAGALGIGFVQYYTVPQEAMQKLLLLPGAIANSVVPKLAKIENNHEWCRLTKKMLLEVGIGFLIIVGVFFFGAKTFFSFWINQDFYEKISSFIWILCIGIYFNGISQYYAAFLAARNKTKQMAICHCIEFPLYMIAIYFLVENFGLVGAAVAWSARVVMDFFFLRWLVKALAK